MSKTYLKSDHFSGGGSVLTKHPTLRNRIKRKLGLREPSGYRIVVPEIVPNPMDDESDG
jgi:hypothetical protein